MMVSWESCVSRDGEQGQASRYILKIEPEKFTDILKERLQNFCLERLKYFLSSFPEENDLVSVFIVCF